MVLCTKHIGIETMHHVPPLDGYLFISSILVISLTILASIALSLIIIIRDIIIFQCVIVIASNNRIDLFC